MGPVVMTVFGILMFIVGWFLVGSAAQGGGTNALGGLLVGIVGGLLWVGGRINARLNDWARWNYNHR